MQVSNCISEQLKMMLTTNDRIRGINENLIAFKGQVSHFEGTKKDEGYIYLCSLLILSLVELEELKRNTIWIKEIRACDIAIKYVGYLKCLIDHKSQDDGGTKMKLSGNWSELAEELKAVLKQYNNVNDFRMEEYFEVAKHKR